MKRALAVLFFACAWGDCGIAQALKSNNFPDATGRQNGLVLIADIAKASQSDTGGVTIPFTLRNVSDKEIDLAFAGWHGVGLAVLNQSGEITDIDNLESKTHFFSEGGPSSRIDLKPGQSTTDFHSGNSVEMLAAVKNRKIFGVLRGYLVNEKKGFICYSAPFLAPSSLITPPWNNLGEQNYLSVMPDLDNVYLSGGSLTHTSIKVNRGNPKYIDLIKNGWAEIIFIPIIVKNASKQEVIVDMDNIFIYINGDEKYRNDFMRGTRPYYFKVTAPILKPGESISSEHNGRGDHELNWFQSVGYKEGDKLIAVVGGRIANTNKIFVCRSAPFELPPLPRAEPPPNGK